METINSKFDNLDFAISKLSLQPGDIVVVKCSITLKPEHAVALRDQMRKFVPGHEVVVIMNPEIDLAVQKAS